MPKLRRKFGKKFYNYDAMFFSKRKASNYVKRLKEAGYDARIIPTHGIMPWEVWSRKK